MVSNLQNVPKITSYQIASSDDDFWRNVCRDNSSEKLLDDFFQERRESQSKAIAILLSASTLRELFMNYHTVIYLPMEQ